MTVEAEADAKGLMRKKELWLDWLDYLYKVQPFPSAAYRVLAASNRSAKARGLPPIEAMLAAKIKLLDDYEEDLLYGTNRKSPKIEGVVLVAFDAEDDSKLTEAPKPLKDGSKVFYLKPTCQAFTFATYQGGLVIASKLDVNEAVPWQTIEDHVRSWLHLPKDKMIYWLTHLSPAELRNIKDWKDHFNPEIGKVMPIHESSIHLQNDNNTIIDTYCYFMASLETVALSVGLVKEKPKTEDHDSTYWMSHMAELKREHPDIFWTYAINDSVILITAFTKLRQWYWSALDIELLNTFQHPTLASAAVYFLRKRFLAPDGVVSMPFKERESHSEAKRKSGLYAWQEPKIKVLHEDFQPIRWNSLRTYLGARREGDMCGLIEQAVTGVDVSGMYNSCGQNQPMPLVITAPGKEHVTQWKMLQCSFDDKETLQKILAMEGFVRMQGYKHPESCRYPIVADQQDYAVRLLWPLDGSKKPGEEAFFTIFELRLAIEHFGLSFDKITAWGFVPGAQEINHPIKAYLQYFQQMKDKASLDKDAFAENMAKLFGNALIGKFVQAIEIEDDDALEEVFGILNFDREHFVKRKKGRPEPAHKKIGEGFFDPEMAALTLGRARGILGLIFALLEAITGHTDSCVFLADKEKEEMAIKIAAQYGVSLKVDWRADGFWLMRSAVYIALQKDGKSGQWIIARNKKDKPIEAHHAVHVSNVSTFYQPIIDAINNKQPITEKFLVHKNSLATMRTERDQGIPVGCFYPKEQEVNMKWDFKRQLPSDFDITKDVFLRSVYCAPYQTVRQAYDEEKTFEHDKRGIRKGPRTKKEKKIDQKRVKEKQKIGHNPRIYVSDAERQKAYRERKKGPTVTKQANRYSSLPFYPGVPYHNAGSA
ncbi:DNA polymerase [Candidatus Bathyarchaeota archaeon]|nr:DNA polymerase [Candidatus Bathyarchaeota archaeon]